MDALIPIFRASPSQARNAYSAVLPIPEVAGGSEVPPFIGSLHTRLEFHVIFGDWNFILLLWEVPGPWPVLEALQATTAYITSEQTVAANPPDSFVSSSLLVFLTNQSRHYWFSQLRPSVP